MSLESQFVPVYDYVLVSEPLTPEQRASIGWARRQGMSDANNQFHYFRLTADDRILWGGYDAVYYPGNGVGPQFDRRPATFEKLEAHFRRAKEAGATILSEPEVEPYGERIYRVEDLEGHRWMFAQPIADPPA